MKFLLLAGLAMFVTLCAEAQYELTLRGSITDSQRDAITDNGYRGVEYPGQHWSSLLSYNAPGSTGQFQLEAFYWGALRFRNKVDNLVWTNWRTIWHDGNLDPSGYLGSAVNVWHADKAGGARFHFVASGGTYIRGYGDQSVIFRNGSDETLVTILHNGGVGIGTADTKGHKLAVAGSVIAERVKVKLQSAWPDYVFRKDYQLPSLQELEQYILRHQHLPGIPAEGEVMKDGVDLGEMNKKLLQKVEELTLYIIRQEKEMKEMKALLGQLADKMSMDKK